MRTSWIGHSMMYVRDGGAVIPARFDLLDATWNFFGEWSGWVDAGETPPSRYALMQNHPNPFNPSTTISFTLEFDDHVTLNVYDVAGRLVATVMDRDLKANDYTVAFRADGLATGVYFYKLSTSKGEETRKMVLLR